MEKPSHILKCSRQPEYIDQPYKIIVLEYNDDNNEYINLEDMFRQLSPDYPVTVYWPYLTDLNWKILSNFCRNVQEKYKFVQNIIRIDMGSFERSAAMYEPKFKIPFPTELAVNDRCNNEQFITILKYFPRLRKFYCMLFKDILSKNNEDNFDGYLESIVGSNELTSFEVGRCTEEALPYVDQILEYFQTTLRTVSLEIFLKPDVLEEEVFWFLEKYKYEKDFEITVSHMSDFSEDPQIYNPGCTIS